MNLSNLIVPHLDHPKYNEEGMNVPEDGFRPGTEVTPIKSGENAMKLKTTKATKIIYPECLKPVENLPVAISPAIVPFPRACIVTP